MYRNIDYADFYILHDYYAKFGAILSPKEMLAAVDTTYSHINVVNKIIKKYTDRDEGYLPIALTEFNTEAMLQFQKMMEQQTFLIAQVFSLLMLLGKL